MSPRGVEMGVTINKENFRCKAALVAQNASATTANEDFTCPSFITNAEVAPSTPT
jgi:hypothetical protein